MELKMNKQEKLSLLSEKVSQCTKCTELVANRSKTVFGNGSPYSKIVVVAEAPGKNENEQGEPLVGRAGKEWNKLLSVVGLVREEVYHCNIIKCWPPKNRKPTEEECKNCTPFIRIQLKIICPKYIMCLGTTAAQTLLKSSTSISQLRGIWHDYKDDNFKAKLLCTFHPAFLFRNPSARKDMISDLDLLIKALGDNHENQ